MQKHFVTTIAPVLTISSAGAIFISQCMKQQRDIQKQKSRSVGSGRGIELFDIHHVKEHEACVVVFVFLGEWLETVLFVEENGREVGIDGDEKLTNRK